MATVIGVRTTNFIGKDGSPITGKNIYFTQPLKDGEGVSGERVFHSIWRRNTGCARPAAATSTANG